MEGTVAPPGADVDFATTTSTSETSYATKEAFRILKNCIQNWFTDVVKNESRDADMLLRHFYRWLRSPSSKMYDPSLHRFIHHNMKKLWLQLMARFRKLGATVVYGTFNKLIINTNKTSISHALSYCKLVLDTIKQRPLFSLLSVEPTLMWETCMFLDAANFGGILSDGSMTTENTDSNKQPEIVSNWNIADYLPDLAQQYFLLVISEFLLLPYQHMKQVEAEREEGFSQSSQALTPEQQ